MRLPKVSVVVAAYNEEKDIGDLLDSLIEINYPRKKLEIIVVDDGSTDKTPEILKKYPIKVVKGPHKGFGNARNLGWKRATGEIVVFFDADMIADKDYVMEVAKHFNRHKDLAGVEGKELLYNKENLLARMHQLRHELGWAQLKVFMPRAIKRRILKEFNGYDQDYGYYIDWDLYRRMLSKDLKMGHAAKAIVYHKQVESLGELYNQCRWNGRSIVFTFKRYRMDAVRRVMFVLLNALVPFYVILLLLPMPFKLLGVVGLITFTLVEGLRSLRMFLITKLWESFLTPIFDVVSMAFILLGMIDKFTSNIKVPVR